MAFEGSVPDERLSIESEGGNSVAETLDGAGGRGANGLASFQRLLRASGGNDAR